MENETRRLIGWLPGEPGGRAVGEGARGEPEGTPERERDSSSNHLLSSGGQAAKPMSRSLSTSDRLSISLAYFDQAPCAYKPSARSPPRFSPCRLAAAGSRSAALLGVLRQVTRPELCAAAEYASMQQIQQRQSRRNRGLEPELQPGGAGADGSPHGKHSSRDSQPSRPRS